VTFISTSHICFESQRTNTWPSCLWGSRSFNSWIVCMHCWLLLMLNMQETWLKLNIT